MNLGAVTYPVACHDKGSDKAASGGRLHYNDSVVYQCGWRYKMHCTSMSLTVGPESEEWKIGFIKLLYYVCDAND